MSQDTARFRHFNRFYTHILGLLNRHILGGPLGLGEARVLYEIGAEPGCRAADLAARLGLDKGQLSRLLSGFEAKGLVTREPDPEDRRNRRLLLTDKGRTLRHELGLRSDLQAASILSRLDRPRRAATLEAMGRIEAALNADPNPPRAVIREPLPGDYGWVVESHGRLYKLENGFGSGFEDYVIHGLSEFLNADPKDRLLLIAEGGGRPVGSVGVMPRPDGPWQLRWFLVEPEYRSQGLGRQLFVRAIDFARERGAPGTYLWTVDALGPARALYSSLGFQCTESAPGSMGGTPVREERWELAF